MPLGTHEHHEYRSNALPGSQAELETPQQHVREGIATLGIDGSTECLIIFLPRRLPQVPSLNAKRLKRVLELIEARLADALKLKDLAREACLSPYHFSRLFHEATGRSPHRYLIERRISTAQTMLLSGHAPIAEVALDVGFGSQANFSRTFRKITGFTPRQYRELHLRGQRGLPDLKLLEHM